MNVLLLTKTSAVSIEDLAAMANAIMLSGNVFTAAWRLRPLSVGALAKPEPWQLKVVQRIITIVGGEAKNADEFSMNGCSSLFDGPSALSVMLDAEIKESLASAAPIGWIPRSGLAGLAGSGSGAGSGPAPAALEDAFEAVGPVLGSSYVMKVRLRGIMRPVSLSNFLLPKWYGQESPASISFDHLGICKNHYEILPSGYHTIREGRQVGPDGGTIAQGGVKTSYGRSFQKSATVQRHIDKRAIVSK